MKRQNSLGISVVIPCYNEEQAIEACLEAVCSQIEPVEEIIVVDNNCTDNTVKLARRFQGVKIIKESRQGLIAARNAGMDYATGDVIARIDVDSRPVQDWSIRLKQSFINPDMQAVTGTGFFYDVPLKKSVRFIRNGIAVHMNRLFLGHNMLWGSNMALRRSCWLQIRNSTCHEKNIMEDLDMASHIYQEYGRDSIVYNHDMRADISGRRAMDGLKNHYLYLKMWPATMRIHGQKGYALSWPVIFMMLAFSLPSSAAMRLYDPEKQKLVLTRQQWRSTRYYDRPNP